VPVGGRYRDEDRTLDDVKFTAVLMIVGFRPAQTWASRPVLRVSFAMGHQLAAGTERSPLLHFPSPFDFLASQAYWYAPLRIWMSTLSN